MPTPDETAFPPSPPIDIPARSSFPSCPPEEEREERRDDSDHDDGEDEEAAALPADHAIAQEPTPEPDALEGASSDARNAQPQSKDRINEDATAKAHKHSPTTASHEAVVAPLEGEMQAQAHAASSNPHASMPFPPQYLDVRPDKDRVSAVQVLVTLRMLANTALC